MNDKYFIDSNIAIYAINGKEAKSVICQTLFDPIPVTSTQVVAESINVMLKKLKYTKEEAFEKASNLLEVCELTHIKESTLKLAFKVSVKYHFSFWDSLIISAALESDCTVLYSEDMSHNQLIDDKLRIVNPFLAM